MTETTQVNSEKYKLKQCEVVRYEDEFGHSYTVNGEPVAGVTTLLGLGAPVEAGLLEYFKRTDKDAQEEILKDATERGSSVHKAIERLLLAQAVRSDEFIRPREKKGIAAFVDFFQKVQPTDCVSEQVVAYLKADIKFAGTLDFIATINGKRILVDFKTSASTSKKHDLQAIAYKEAVEQSTNEKIDACYVLYVGTNHKGTRSSIDENGLPTTGFGWNLVRATSTFQDFGHVYRLAILFNNGKYPSPPKVEAYPEQWQILTKEG